MSHETTAHPNGDGLTIVPNHMDAFNTPKHSGFNTPICATGFNVPSPGEVINVPALYEIKEEDETTDFVAGTNAKAKVLSVVYSVQAPRLVGGTFTTNDDIVGATKTFNDIIARALSHINLEIKIGIIEVQLSTFDFAQEFIDAGTSLPPSMTMVAGTNTNVVTSAIDWEGMPNLVDFNAARAVAGPASTGDWTHVFYFVLLNPSLNPAQTTQMTTDHDDFWIALNGDVYSTDPFVTLVPGDEYALDLYQNGIGESDNLKAIMTRLINLASRSWGYDLVYRAPDAVTGFSAVAQAGGDILITWSPPSASPEYKQVGAQDAVFVSHDISKLAIDSNDRIKSDPFAAPRTSRFCLRELNTSPFLAATSFMGYNVGDTVYFRIRTHSNDFTTAYGVKVIDGEATAIFSAVVIA